MTRKDTNAFIVESLLCYNNGMKFYEYLNVLSKYVTEENSKGLSFVTIASLFLDDIDVLQLLHKQTDDMEKADIKHLYKYFRGERTVSKRIAKILLTNYCPNLFYKKLDELSDELRNSLCEDLRQYNIKIGDKTLEDKCAKIYIQFLKNLTKGIDSYEERIQAEPLRGKISKEFSKDAKAFCIEYSDYDELLPLCEIAAKIHPLEKNHRKMYNDFKLLDSKQQSEVFKLKEREFIKFDPNKIETLLKRYKEDLDKYNLSTRDFLYDGAKYFHRAFERYKDRLLADYNDRIYKQHLKVFNSDMYVEIGSYIVDYWENPQKNMLPPMDFMWEECNLGSCDEDEMVFYVNNFIMWSIIIICNKTKPDGFSYEHFLEDYHQTTFEDRYYYILYLLTIAYS